MNFGIEINVLIFLEPEDVNANVGSGVIRDIDLT